MDSVARAASAKGSAREREPSVAEPRAIRARRIAILLYSLGDRAVAREVVHISGVLADMGIEVVLIDLHRSQSTLPLPEGVSVRHVDAPTRWPILGVRRLASSLREVNADVLFAQLNGPGRAAIAARRLARASTRIVVVEQIHYSFYLGHRWLRDHLTRLLYPRADRIAGVSPGVVQELLTRFPRLEGKTTVLPVVGPDRRRLGPSEPPDHPWYRRRDGGRLICSVGNIVPRKGHHTLIEALPLVRLELGDVRLALIGRFDDAAYVTRLQRLAEDLNVSESVWLGGYRPDALPYIAHADAFALGSSIEGAGIVLLEAMACKVPVVSTDCPAGPAYLLDGGRCGLLVPVGDHDEMARALVRALSDMELRRTLIPRALRRVDRFTPRRIARDYLALADDCVASASAGGKR